MRLRTDGESRAWACGGAAASGRLQIRDGGNNRAAISALYRRRRRFCRASSPCRDPRAPCDDASPPADANSRGLRGLAQFARICSPVFGGFCFFLPFFSPWEIFSPFPSSTPPPLLPPFLS